MRRTALAAVGIATILMLVSSAQAISGGPGGRIYTTGRNSDGNAIVLYSFTIDENWDNTSVFYTDHGEIRDVCPSSSRKRYSGSSPELQTFAGSGYGSIVIGGTYDNDPTSWLGGSNETMDVLKVTPSDVGMSIEVLGSGKAIVGAGSGWSHRLDTSTEAGQFAIPDPNGEMMGDPSAVILEAGVYNSNLFVNKDAYGDSDLTDNDADYVISQYGVMVGFEEDFELYDGKLWTSSTYSYYESGTDGIFYRQVEADNSISRTPFYYDRNSELSEDQRTGAPLDYNGFGLAVGEVQGHTAAWGVIHDPDCGTWGTNLLAIFIDLNDDGDAMDNAEVTGSADEYRAFYSSSSTGNDFDNPSIGWTDLELITNENGTMFLLIQDETNAWARGRAMYVMELADNGEFVGGDDGVKLIFREKTAWPGSVPTGWLMPGVNYRETEFDPNPLEAGPVPGDANGDGKVDGADLAIWQQNYDPLGAAGNNTFALGDWNEDGKIDGADLALWQQNYDPLGSGGLDGLGGSVPEPATLLLLGSGLAGGIGFIRRRRMK